MIVVGDFADQKGVPLPAAYLSFQSVDPSVASISATGRLTGLAEGTTILLVSSHGVLAATAVSVGVPQDGLGQQLYTGGLSTYPLAVSLDANGGTRQFKI